MSPQRRTALISVLAAIALIAVKLVTGLGSGSLGLVAEALHSGTDLVAALLTFFALGYAVKPADTSHQYGHHKAEHLAALAEASVLGLVSIGVGALAAARLGGALEPDVTATGGRSPPWVSSSRSTPVAPFVAPRRAPLPEPGSALECAPLRERPGRHACGARGPDLRPGRLEAGDSVAALSSPVSCSSPPRADPSQRRRAHGSGAGRRGGGRPARDRTIGSRSRWADSGSGRRPVDLRRCRDRGHAGRGRRPGPRGGRRGRAGVARGASGHRRRRPCRAGRHRGRADPERALAAALGVPRVREIHDVAVLRLAGRPSSPST